MVLIAKQWKLSESNKKLPRLQSSHLTSVKLTRRQLSSKSEDSPFGELICLGSTSLKLSRCMGGNEYSFRTGKASRRADICERWRSCLFGTEAEGPGGRARYKPSPQGHKRRRSSCPGVCTTSQAAPPADTEPQRFGERGKRMHLLAKNWARKTRAIPSAGRKRIFDFNTEPLLPHSSEKSLSLVPEQFLLFWHILLLNGSHSVSMFLKTSQPRTFCSLPSLKSPCSTIQWFFPDPSHHPHLHCPVVSSRPLLPDECIRLSC